MSASQESERVGLAVWPGTPAPEAIQLGKLTDEAGFDSIWVTESTLAPGRDSISIMGALAASTSKVKLASGIINIFTRTPTLIASTVATLDELSNGRTILGLGTGHKDPVTNWHSVSFRKPMTRMSEYVDVIRRILLGETVEYHGESVSVKGFKLALKPVRDRVPIYVAAVGGKMAELAGKIGDGILITMNTISQLERLLRNALEASREARRNNFEAAAYILSFLSEDAEQALRTAKRVIATYCSAPFYNKVFVDAGFEKEALEIANYWSRGNRDSAIDVVTDRMIRDFAAIGVSETLEMVEKFRAAGVTLPIISPVYTPDFKESISKLIAELAV